MHVLVRGLVEGLSGSKLGKVSASGMSEGKPADGGLEDLISALGTPQEGVGNVVVPR